jgi:hypothetical protein
MDLVTKLSIAWKRVQEDRSTDFLLGDFEYQAFHRFRGRLLKQLAKRIEEEGLDFAPKSLRQIRVPKGSFTTRPGSVPELDDRVYYQALVDDVADQIEPNLSPIKDGVLHSYRYSGKRSAGKMFLQKRASYRTFSQRIRQLGKAHDWVVVTDVATFYERIYHHDLENTLRGLGGDPDTVRQVMNLLRHWRKGSSYGIPQGIWPSDYLGNAYLDPIDKFMVRAGFDLCRYVDDIRVAADSFLEAQGILVQLEERLSSLGLALGGAKTDVVDSARLEEVLFPYKPRFDEIFNELREVMKGVMGLTDPYTRPDPADLAELEETVELASVRELFREELEERFPNPFVARFCLATLTTFRDADLVDEVLDKLGALVEVSPRVVVYLVRVAKEVGSAGKIRKHLARFIQAEDATVYDWQRMWMLQALNRIGDLNGGTVGSIRDILMNQRHSLHDAVVVQALLLVGQHGDDADRRWISELYDEEHSPWIRRAILYSIRGLDKAKRNHFYKYCRGEDPITDAVIDYAISETP